ncbi:hypothetical protein V8E53_011080, partial [Lactarius tabidus]
AFFKSRRGASFAQKNCQWFPKIESGPKVGELMLPSAMVAIAAVAVHASLEEKAIGVEFNADTYEDTYHTHLGTLSEIQERNPPVYYRLMSDLYKLASNQLRIHGNGSSNNAMKLLNLDGMDV